MTIAEALSIFEQVRKAVNLNGTDHDNVRDAMDTIKTALEAKHGDN